MDFMKRTGQCLLAVAAMALIATTAQADTVTVNFTGVAPVGPKFLWTYNITEDVPSVVKKGDGIAPGDVTSDSPASTVPDYFTIYDFYGWDGVAPAAVVDWSFEARLVGSKTFGFPRVDDPGIFNLTWWYTGADKTVSGVVFSATSIYGTSRIGQYSSEDHKGANKGYGLGTVEVPSPEPTTLFLMGSGLVSMAIARRRKNKNQA